MRRWADRLGGVAWFKWQDQILGGLRPAQASHAVGKDFDELLRVQGILYAISDMKPTQDDTLDLLDRLGAGNIATHVLTARGPQYVSATRRELADADITFTLAPRCGMKLCERRGVIETAHVLESARALLGDDTAAEFSTSTSRTISIRLLITPAPLPSVPADKLHPPSYQSSLG